MTRSKRYLISWVVLLAVAFLVRVGVALYWENKISDDHVDSSVETTTANDGPFFFGDSDSYWKLGRAIAFNRPYEFDDERHWQIFRTPGYPIVLAPLFCIWGETPPVMAARIQGALFGVVNVALVGWLTAMLFPLPTSTRRLISFLSGIFVAFDPTLLLQSILVLSEESFLTFELLQMCCVVQVARLLGVLPFPSRDLNMLDKGSRYVEWTAPKNVGIKTLLFYALLMGTVTAATIYIRPSWYYFLPFTAILLLLFRLYVGNVHEIDDYHYTLYDPSFSWKKILFTSIATVTIVLLSLSPWIQRNYKLTGEFIPTSLQMGASLYDGLNPNATGASNMDFVDRFRQEELEYPSDSTNVHFEVRLDRRLKKESLDWTQNHIKEALRLSIVKLGRLWGPVPHEQAFARPIFKYSLAFSFLPVFILGLLGAYRSVVRKGAVWILLIPAIYVSSLHSIFVSSIRYRTPVLFGFSILTAYWLVTTWTVWRQKREKN